jgi:hypothetical protein
MRLAAALHWSCDKNAMKNAHSQMVKRKGNAKTARIFV